MPDLNSLAQQLSDWWLERSYGRTENPYPEYRPFQNRTTQTPGFVAVTDSTKRNAEYLKGHPSDAIRINMRSGPKRDADTLRALKQLSEEWKSMPRGFILTDPQFAMDPEIMLHEASHAQIDRGQLGRSVYQQLQKSMPSSLRSQVNLSHGPSKLKEEAGSVLEGIAAQVMNRTGWPEVMYEPRKELEDPWVAEVMNRLPAEQRQQMEKIFRRADWLGQQK